MPVTYISWAPHCSRSDTTARELEGKSHMVYLGQLGSRPSTIWLKYLGQAIRTWRILLREKPEAVFVMTPPFVAGLVVVPYCALWRVPLVVDAHTAAFLGPRWRHFQKIQHWICRRAATTIVTNTHLVDLLERHGSDATILADVPVKYPDTTGPFDKKGFTVAVICSFDYDEPVDVIWEAAKALPDVHFRVTGDPAKLRPELRSRVPANLQLTGFLDNASYGQLLRKADVVMAVTDGKHKQLRGAYEAIYEGTPIIISESPMLREEFPKGAILVENSGERFAAAIREMQNALSRYRQEAAELREWKLDRWRQAKALLLTKIGKETRVNVGQEC
jgi:glycosyltransferase involved in cell wall biosynthesis